MKISNTKSLSGISATSQLEILSVSWISLILEEISVLVLYPGTGAHSQLSKCGGTQIMTVCRKRERVVKGGRWGKREHTAGEK